MSKYKELVIYSGNLIKYTNGQCEPYKKNVYLIYNSTLDIFYSWDETLNYFLDLDLNNNLSEDKYDEYGNIIKKHSYSYINKGIEGQIYVDENSIRVVIDSSNKHR